MNWIKARAVEPSTWRGVGALFVTLGVASAGSVDAVIAVGLAVVSLVEIVRREK